MLRLAFKYLILFLFGGSTYLLMEYFSRDGNTHWVMGIVGGICFILVGLLNENRKLNLPFWVQCIYGGFIITAVELVSGIIINRVLQLNVWDYSDHKYQNMGQICIEFTILWCFLSSIAIIADDYIRYWFFDGKKPRYKKIL